MHDIFFFCLSLALSAIVCGLIDWEAFCKIFLGKGKDDDDDGPGGSGGIMQPIYIPVNRTRR